MRNIYEKMYTVEQAAEKLRISRSTLQHLTAERGIGFYRLGRRIFFTEADLAGYLQTRRVEPAAQEVRP